MGKKDKDVSKVPNLRFPRFEDEWIVRKLGELATFSKGKGISKNDIEENGINECIRYGELYTHYDEVINKVKSKTNVNPSTLVLSEANNVIIPASGETRIDIATASCVLKSGIALGGDLNIIQTDINGVFLSYYLNSKKKLEIARLAQGISVVHLYSSQLASLILNVPIQEEQNKISSFLIKLDEHIHTQNKTIEQLETLMNGLVQNIFSQKIQFKNDTGNEFPDWEEKKLNEICVKKSSNISANTLKDITGDYKIYGATGYLQNVNFYQEDEPYISIVKDGAGVGRTMLCESFSSVLGTLDKIKSPYTNNLYFLYLVLNNIKFEKFITGSTIPHIYFKDYSKEKIKLPCTEEQSKIVSFLSSISEKIQIEKAILEQLEKQKKYLLQQLFI